jgi:perosamine synthetase
VAVAVPFTRPGICPEAGSAVLDVLSSGWVTTGEQVGEFEREFADYVGARYAVAVSSCTAAIELSLRSLGLARGAKVLMSTMTFCGAAAAIRHAGLTPVLADVDPVTAMPSEATVTTAARAAGGVDAMVVLHLGGLATDVDAMAEAAGLDLGHVIEDAAHALGAGWGERAVGTLSHATCFSFYATKNLAIGEGGMVTTDDPQLAEQVRTTRLHGMSKDAWRRYLPGGGWRYDVAVDGLKANMTDIQAAIGRAQLRHLDQYQAHRALAAHRYDEVLAGISGIDLPPRPTTGWHAWHLYAVRVRPDFGVARDDVIEGLLRRGIGSSVHFIPVHQLSWYGHECVLPPGGFPGADGVFEQTLSLPLDQVITTAEVDAVCGALAEIQDFA